MIPPRLVVFDLGKVLVDFDYAISAQRFLPRCQGEPAEILNRITSSPLLVEYELGRLSTRQFYEQVRELTRFQGDQAEFEFTFGDIFTPIEPMIDLHRQIRSQGLTTCIFSNTNEIAVRHIRRVFPFFAHFDDYFYSFQHRVMKPDPRFYEVLEQKMGVPGADILYLDDRPENITAGCQRGWRGILHEDPQKTRQAVRQNGVELA